MAGVTPALATKANTVVITFQQKLLAIQAVFYRGLALQTYIAGTYLHNIPLQHQHGALQFLNTVCGLL